MSALPVLARILSERRMLNTRIGTLAMTVAAVDDVFGYVLLAVTLAILRSNDSLGVLWTVLLAIAELVFMWIVVRPLIRFLVKRDQGHSHLSADTFLFLSIVLIACSYLAELIGLSSLIGAFQVGLLIPRTSQLSVHLSEKIEYFVVTILMPIFFVGSGLRTQFGLINDGTAVGMCILVIAVATLSKIVGIMFPFWFMRLWNPLKLPQLPTRVTAIMGVLMSCKGLIALIVVNFGLTYEIITDRFFAILVLMVLVTTIMTVPLMQCVDPPSRQKQTAALAAAFDNPPPASADYEANEAHATGPAPRSPSKAALVAEDGDHSSAADGIRHRAGTHKPSMSSITIETQSLDGSGKAAGAGEAPLSASSAAAAAASLLSRYDEQATLSAGKGLQLLQMLAEADAAAAAESSSSHAVPVRGQSGIHLNMSANATHDPRQFAIELIAAAAAATRQPIPSVARQLMATIQEADEEAANAPAGLSPLPQGLITVAASAGAQPAGSAQGAPDLFVLKEVSADPSAADESSASGSPSSKPLGLIGRIKSMAFSRTRSTSQAVSAIPILEGMSLPALAMNPSTAMPEDIQHADELQADLHAKGSAPSSPSVRGLSARSRAGTFAPSSTASGPKEETAADVAIEPLVLPPMAAARTSSAGHFHGAHPSRPLRSHYRKPFNIVLAVGAETQVAAGLVSITNMFPPTLSPSDGQNGDQSGLNDNTHAILAASAIMLDPEVSSLLEAAGTSSHEVIQSIVDAAGEHPEVIRRSASNASDAPSATVPLTRSTSNEAQGQPLLKSLGLRIPPPKVGYTQAKLFLSWVLDSMEMPSSYMNTCVSISDIRDVSLAGAMSRSRQQSNGITITTFPSTKPLEDSCDEAVQRRADVIVCSPKLVLQSSSLIPGLNRASTAVFSTPDAISAVLQRVYKTARPCRVALLFDYGSSFAMMRALVPVIDGSTSADSALWLLRRTDPDVEAVLLKIASETPAETGHRDSVAVAVDGDVATGAGATSVTSTGPVDTAIIRKHSSRAHRSREPSVATGTTAAVDSTVESELEESDTDSSGDEEERRESVTAAARRTRDEILKAREAMSPIAGRANTREIRGLVAQTSPAEAAIPAALDRAIRAAPYSYSVVVLGAGLFSGRAHHPRTESLSGASADATATTETEEIAVLTSSLMVCASAGIPALVVFDPSARQHHHHLSGSH
jgi:Kef-type K+ transport system membrane component KefB